MQASAAPSRSRVFLSLSLFAALVVLAGSSDVPAESQESPRDVVRDQRDQERVDQAWRAAGEGFMRVEKITYRSRADNLDVPAFVFQPLKTRRPRGHAALVWVHEDVRGRLYQHYIPYIREATAKGYVVIAPEYRGGIGHGKAHYDAIDYGGAEVDDVITGSEVLRAKYPHVDPERIGVIGWSHGGMIALLSTFREPTMFKAAVAIAPVTNLIQRTAWKGAEYQKLIDPQNRYGGTPAEKRDLFKDRSPLYNVDKLQIPLLVHVTKNDEDVNIEEAMELVDALRSRKPLLAETKVYDNPLGGHTFDRRVDPRTWQPENTREQRDSWNRVWTFLDWNLDPFRDASAAVGSTRQH